jgi:hypothetical protein
MPPDKEKCDATVEEATMFLTAHDLTERARTGTMVACRVLS